MKYVVVVCMMSLVLTASLFAESQLIGVNQNLAQEIKARVDEFKAHGQYDAGLWQSYFDLFGSSQVPNRGGQLDQGGEDCAAATVIASLPFSDVGTTFGFADDYGTSDCGFAGGAPDVVYSYTPAFAQVVDVSLCGGSNFDTELYIYAGSCADPTIACNDDYCGFASFLGGVALSAGVTYYIVVDGFGDSFGDYTLDVSMQTTGRCCYNLTECAETTFQQCNALGGEWTEGATCADACPEPPAQCACGPMDIVFVVDTTGSMGAAIQNVSNALPTIIATAEYVSCDLQLGLVTFGDEVVVNHQLTTDFAAVQASITGLTANGGSLAAEASDEALLEIISGSSGCAVNSWTSIFRPGATGVLVLITDAPPGGCDDTYDSGVDDVHAHNVALAAAAAGLRIAAVYVPTSPVNTPIVVPVMQDYATTTNGTYRQTAPDGQGTGAAINAIVAQCGGACVPLCDLVEDPCVIPVGCYRTQTQGGWGIDRCRGHNPRCILDANFDFCFPNGLVVGGDHTLTLTSAAAVGAFLPQGKQPGMLIADYVDPVNANPGAAATSAGVFAGQVVTLAINIGFGDCGVMGFGDVGSLVISQYPFFGWTVDALFALANEVLGGDNSNLPAGTTISDLNDAVTAINEGFDDGSYSSGYLVDPCCQMEAPRRSRGVSSSELSPITQASPIAELGNHPNPFNPTTTISFVIKDAGMVSLKVYNMMGQEVATLLNETVEAGRHQAMFNAADLSTGLYFYRLETGGQSFQQKMLLIK